MNYKRLIFFTSILLILLTPIVAQAQDVCSSDGTQEQFETTFVNDSNTTITVYWVDYDCQETLVGVIEPGAELPQTTYDGHEFTFYNPNGDLLMWYIVNTLNAGDEIRILRTVNEGAAAGAMWELINPAREEMGLEPIYFSRTLYHIAEEAAKMTGGDYSAFADAVASMGLEDHIGWAGNSSGPLSGSLLSTTDIQDIMIRSAQEKLDSNDSFGWFDPNVKSFAVYADENVYGVIYSTMSQPELALGLANSGMDTMGGPLFVESISSVSGYLSAAVDMDYYTFEGEADVVYGISLRSNDFDTYLHLYDAEGNEIAANDDAGGDLNSLILFTAPSDDLYTIGVDSYWGDAEGYYNLSITHTSTVILNLLMGAESDNTLDAVEGTTYFVSVNSENFDTIVSILDENGDEIAYNDDYNNDTNSLVVFTAPTSGQYTIRVSSYMSSDSGATATSLEYNVLIGTFPN